jgi:hypothetical protein
MNVFRYLVTGAASGALFAVLDGVLNANPMAQRLSSYLKPLSRERMPVAAGLAVDLAWGFGMAGVFVLLYPSLPGHLGVWKGLSFGALAWFFRVLMRAGSDAVMLKIPAAAVVYQIVAGALEMALIGILYGLLLP